ncbi:MAG: sugar transferase [Candidatus Spechtbacteria bacterium]|nr:sugar transferase [Candidatus Spechtbacteria bacterium]
MRKADFLFTVALVPVDFMMCISAAFAAYFLRLSPWARELRPVVFSLPIIHYLTVTLGIVAFFLLIFAVSGLYKTGAKRGGLEEFFQIVVSMSAAMMTIIIFMFFKRDWFDSRFIMLAAWFFGIVFVAIGRLFAAKVRRTLIVKRGFGVERVLLVGYGEQADLIKKEIETNPEIGYSILGHIPAIDLARIKDIVKNPGAHKIILTNQSFERNAVVELINFCEDMRIDLKFVPDLFGAVSRNIGMDILGGNPLIELKRTNLEAWGLVMKRILDILLAGLSLPFLLPLFLCVGFFIKWETKGPVFVRLRRVSQGKEFDLMKFRSMIAGAAELKPYLVSLNERNDGPLFKMKDDPRITKVGRFIRSKRIDELPQIFNVLKGDLSLVGPRPHEPEEVARYERHHKKVLAIKSGVTGLAQISGAEQLPFEEEVKLDRYYIENWSLKKDVAILLKTLGILIFGKTGY